MLKLRAVQFVFGKRPGSTEVTMRVLEVKDIVPLLRAEVQRAGGISAWSKKTGVNRTVASKVVNNLKPPTKSVIKALKLRAVFVVSKDWPKRPTRSR
jgi:hypothetical protein